MTPQFLTYELGGDKGEEGAIAARFAHTIKHCRSCGDLRLGLACLQLNSCYDASAATREGYNGLRKESTTSCHAAR